MSKFKFAQPLFINAAPFPAPPASSPSPSSKKAAKNSGPKQLVEVDFRELADGTLVEAIEDRKDPSKSVLAIYKDGQVRYAEKLAIGSQVLIPVARTSAIIRHVSFTNGAEVFKSVRDLLADVLYVVLLTLDLSLEHSILLSSFVLSSWLTEKLPVAPYVALIGAPGTGKTTALRVLDLLCRRSLLTADISSAGFYELCNRMTTTVLIDEAATATNRREVLHLLRAGSTQGLAAIRKDNSYRLYGARAISWLELPDDAALNSRCILIPMKCCRRTDLLSPSDPRVLDVAQRIRRRLLQFRFMNFNTLTRCTIPGEGELHPRTRDLFQCLAMPLNSDLEGCELLLSILKKQESLREVLTNQQSAVLDYLFEMIHAHPNFSGLRVGEMTKQVNAILRERGEPRMITEKKMGLILTSLHLTNRTRTNEGYVLWLDIETRKEIHALARAHCAKTAPDPDGKASCNLCRHAISTGSTGTTNKPDTQCTPVKTSTPERESGERGVTGQAKRKKPTRSTRAGKPGRKSR
jgi:hypothetical protein